MNRRISVQPKMATRPHYRRTAERDNALSFLFTMGWSFVIGAMAGATLAMAVLQ